MSRTQAAIVVALVSALPRLAVLAYERGTILEEFVEKSDRFATTFVETGTFGFLPGVPSAYTQPLYAFFLSGLYWPFGRSWLAVGLAQIVVATATALLVLEIGRRLRSVAVGVVAAVIATLHPYVVWHDVHVNREILDGFLLALVTLLALVAYERRSRWAAAALGGAAGLAILGNTRLALLPLVLGVFVAWPVRPAGRTLAAGAVVVVAAVLVVAPWVVRNEVSVGCVAITTDARALWKANNDNTYDVLASGQWIDDVPELAGAPPWPELAADLTLGGTPTTVDECAQMRLYRDEVLDFWRDRPGEKARLAAQAAGMLWRPTFTVTAEGDSGSRSGLAGTSRRLAEPAFMVVLYALALAGCLVVRRRFLVLTLLLVGTNTVMAMVFAGTVRYRAPFDFLLALLAACALERGWAWVRGRRYRGATRASTPP